jgi:hypothetical protein
LTSPNAIQTVRHVNINNGATNFFIGSLSFRARLRRKPG